MAGGAMQALCEQCQLQITEREKHWLNLWQHVLLYTRCQNTGGISVTTEASWLPQPTGVQIMMQTFSLHFHVSLSLPLSLSHKLNKQSKQRDDERCCITFLFSHPCHLSQAQQHYILQLSFGLNLLPMWLDSFKYFETSWRLRQFKSI